MVDQYLIAPTPDEHLGKSPDIVVDVAVESVAGHVSTDSTATTSGPGHPPGVWVRPVEVGHRDRAVLTQEEQWSQSRRLGQAGRLPCQSRRRFSLWQQVGRVLQVYTTEVVACGRPRPRATSTARRSLGRRTHTDQAQGKVAAVIQRPIAPTMHDTASGFGGPYSVHPGRAVPGQSATYEDGISMLKYPKHESVQRKRCRGWSYTAAIKPVDE